MSAKPKQRKIAVAARQSDRSGLISLPCGLARNCLPRRKRILDPFERGRDLRHVPLQNAREAVVADPLETLLCVNLRPVIVGEETIALEPPRRHQEEDAEGRLAKA